MRLGYKKNFYLLQCIAQTYLDESRFKSGGSTLRKTIDFRKWRLAEKYIIRSFDLHDNHAETLYTMGEIRKLGGQDEIAIYCFKRILKLGVNEIAKQQYSRGRAFAKELVNDAKFELYRLYFNTDPPKSMRYLAEFERGVAQDVGTIFKPLKKFYLS